MTWFLAKTLGLQRWAWALIAIAALGAGILWLNHREEADDKANQDIGAAAQRETDLRETIERTETANEARNDVRVDDTVRYEQCLRTARTPANCQRFLPSSQAD